MSKKTATMSSMTGFARAQGQNETHQWVIEAKSLNAKGLDVRVKYPHGFDDLESMVRDYAASLFKRGGVHVHIALDAQDSAQNYALNTALLDDIKKLAVAMETEGWPKQNLDSILSVRGVVEQRDHTDFADEQARTALRDQVFESIKASLSDLKDNRDKEGAALAGIVKTHLETITDLTAAAADAAAARPEKIRQRIKEQVTALLDAKQDLPEERLHQELAYIAVKSDIREEIDRLKAHIDNARDLLQRGVAIGRQFDFLCQEFHREANTLCSKSGDVELTQIGLDLKTCIDQLREQIQNVE